MVGRFPRQASVRQFTLGPVVVAVDAHCCAVRQVQFQDARVFGNNLILRFLPARQVDERREDEYEQHGVDECNSKLQSQGTVHGNTTRLFCDYSVILSAAARPPAIPLEAPPAPRTGC